MMTRRRWQLLLVWVLIIGCWEGAYRAIGWRSWLFPAPSHVVDATMSMIGVPTHFGEPIGKGWPMSQEGIEQAAPPQSTLPKAVLVSLVRLVVGFAISLALGMFMGLLMWRVRFVDQLLGPAFLGLQTLPSVCWVPLAILTLGINEMAILMVLILGSFPAMAISLRDGLHTMPPIYHRAGLMLGARKWRLYRYVLLPASLPAMASMLRQGFSFAWRSLMGAELIFVLANRGLGFLLSMGRDFADVAQVVAVMIIMIVIAMAVDRGVFAPIETRVRRRFGLIAQT